MPFALDNESKCDKIVLPHNLNISFSARATDALSAATVT